MSLSLKKKKKEKLEVFSFFILTNELMDMEAAAVFVKNLLESTGYFLMLCSSFLYSITSSHFVIFLMQFP